MGRPVEKAIQSRQDWQQLKEKPPHRQGNTFIQATTSGGRTMEEAFHSRQGWQQLKEEQPDRQGNQSMKATASGAEQ